MRMKPQGMTNSFGLSNKIFPLQIKGNGFRKKDEDQSNIKPYSNPIKKANLPRRTVD